MLASLGAAAFAIAALAGLSILARLQHRAAMAQRGALLDGLRDLVQRPRLVTGPDGFPILSGELGDGRSVKVELIVDSLVARRLPQVWLAVTVRDAAPITYPRFGALARPNGAEFYSWVHDMPERLEASENLDQAVLVRGDQADPYHLANASVVVREVFSDSRAKEIAARGTEIRVVRQAFEGDRAAYLWLRQPRFPLTAIAAEPVLLCIAQTDRLAGVLRRSSEPSRLSA